jgi:hypothetical protein
MTTRDALVAELDLENPFTRRTLERVPLEKRAWKPHDRSMALGDLATFLCVMWSWGVVVIENVAAFRSALMRTTDDHLQLKWRLLVRGEEFFNQPRGIVLSTFILNHAVHHRAQLGVYLRLNGVAVPAIYNDSADEQGGLFRPDGSRRPMA